MRIGHNIKSEFDEFSVNYTEDMTRCVPHYQKLLSAFTLDLPRDFRPKRILDLGCGNGNVTAVLLQQFPESNYVLLDASDEMLNLCGERFGRFDIEYVQSYFSNYEFATDQFDYIAAGFSLHHCESEEKKELFQKINKALTPTGMFGFSDLMIHKDNPGHPQLLKEWKAFVDPSYPDGEKWEWLMEHYDAFDNPDEYEDQFYWLEEAGFRNIHPVVREDGCWAHLRARK